MPGCDPQPPAAVADRRGRRGRLPWERVAVTGQHQRRRGGKQLLVQNQVGQTPPLFSGVTTRAALRNRTDRNSRPTATRQLRALSRDVR